MLISELDFAWVVELGEMGVGIGEWVSVGGVVDEFDGWVFPKGGLRHRGRVALALHVDSMGGFTEREKTGEQRGERRVMGS